MEESSSSEMHASENRTGFRMWCQAPRRLNTRAATQRRNRVCRSEGQRARCFVSSLDAGGDRRGSEGGAQERGAKSGIGCSVQRIRSVPIKGRRTVIPTR